MSTLAPAFVFADALDASSLFLRFASILPDVRR